MNIRRLLFHRRDTDPGPYEVAMVDAGRFHIQVTESPRKRSVQIHVDNEQVWKS